MSSDGKSFDQFVCLESAIDLEYINCNLPYAVLSVFNPSVHGHGMTSSSGWLDKNKVYVGQG